MNLLKSLIMLLIVTAVLGCQSYAQLRDENRDNISSVQIGDTEDSVVAKMGNKTADSLQYGKAANPYKRESVSLNNVNYTIWYYYTERIGEQNWEAGMTPVVFVNGKVVAVGWRSMERLGLDSDSSMTIRRR